MPRSSPRDGEPGIARDLGQAEVGDPELPAEVQQQVARLDVPVHDAQTDGRVPAPAPPACPGRPPGRNIGGPTTARARCSSRQAWSRLAARISGWPAGRFAPGRSGVSFILRSGLVRIRLVAKAAELANQRGEALPVDELHRVVVDAALAADRVHRDDPLVLHVRRGQRLGLEALEAARVDGRGERQDLERDPPPQRDLLGLVDDAHPPTAHLAQEAKVAELADAWLGVVRLLARRAGAATGVAWTRGAEGCREPGHLVVTGEERFQVLPEVGVRRQELDHGRAPGPPRAPRRRPGGRGSAAPLESSRRSVHDSWPDSTGSRSSSRSRFNPRKSRPTAAGRVRPICSATSATASPFK